MDRIQDIREFEEMIFDALKEFMETPELYPLDAVLQINSQSMEISIDSPTKDENVDNISLTKLLDNDIIDCDEINEIANKYFFVR